MIMEDDHDDVASSSSSSLGVSSSATYDGSSSGSLDFAEDASSFSSSGPLFEFSELMATLPIKRGLSKFYEGKSQSFTSLSRVKTLEDLAKRKKPSTKGLKACKSYGGGMHALKSYSQISKKVSRNSPSNLSLQRRRGACRFYELQSASSVSGTIAYDDMKLKLRKPDQIFGPVQ